MSLEKSINSGRERRKPIKSASLYCLNNGGCSWCEKNRFYRTNKQLDKTNEQVKEYNENDK